MAGQGARDARQDAWSLRVAAFVTQALGLPMPPEELAPGVATLRRDGEGGVAAVELSSSVGSTPFLVYAYALPGGQARFDADVATMERAARLDTPGPRIVASATTDEEAFVLATTPGVQRLLSGEGGAGARSLPDARAATRIRREAPGKLIEAVRRANDLAGEWLGALHVAAEGSEEAELTFTDAESALALYLLDDASAGDLLRALNLALAAARGGTGPG